MLWLEQVRAATRKDVKIKRGKGRFGKSQLTQLRTKSHRLTENEVRLPRPQKEWNDGPMVSTSNNNIFENRNAYSGIRKKLETSGLNSIGMRKHSNSSSKMIYTPYFYNPAGPGDYNIPSYSETGMNRKAPLYSMGPKTKVPYFKGFEIEFVGKDAPGVNRYMPSHNYVRMSLPEWSQAKGARFNGDMGSVMRKIKDDLPS